MHVRCLIAICTHDRSAMLEETLSSLAAVTRPADLDVQVLVVANACTDDTVAVASKWRGPFPLEVVEESRVGLSNARNRVLSHLEGTPADMLLWLDDDVEVATDFLTAYAAAWEAHPDRLVFGGRILPRFLPPSPPDLDFLVSVVGLHPFSCLDLGSVGCDVDPHRGLPFGANMAVRLRPDDLSRRFDLRLGVTPRRKVGFEETVYLNEILGGSPWRYVPDACIRHLMPPRRQTRTAVRQFYRGIGQYEGILATNATPPVQTLLGRPRWLWRACLQATLARVWARVRRDDAGRLLAELEAEKLAGYSEAFGESIPPEIAELIR